MESRIYEERFLELRNSIFSLLKTKNTKAIEYEEKAVSEYIERLSKGDFQTKSLKSKAIYFEGQREKYLAEVKEIIASSYKAIRDFLDDVMVQMEAEKDSLEIQERRNDLLLINQEVKRKRQDNANKMNALDRDYQQRLKDLASVAQDTEKASLNYLNEASRKISQDAQKVIDNYNKKILPIEKSLLEVDEKAKILEIKAKIKEIRTLMLKEEHELKLDSFKKNNEELIILLNDASNATIELEKVKSEYQLIRLENNKSNDLLSVESEENIFNYDVAKRDKGIELINDIFNQKVDYYNIIRDQKRNVYARELYLKKKYNDKLFLIATTNPIHPFLSLINHILKEYNEYASYFNELIEEGNKKRNDSLLDAGELVLKLNLDLFNGKAKERRKLDETVRRSISSLLSTDLFNDEYNEIIDFFDKILNIFKTNDKELDKKDEFLNNIYVYEKTINRYDAKEKFDLDMAYISSEFTKYKDNYNDVRAKDLKAFNGSISEKKKALENKFENNKRKIEDDLAKIINDEKLKLDKKISDANNEYDRSIALEEKNYKTRTLTL